jgi:predicted nuclease of predicted toxin-antitoxin system
VRFLVDAQLPARLARFLSSAGHDALHTSELPDGNRTTDRRIAEVADDDNRVVVTKDRDFRDSLRRIPGVTAGPFDQPRQRRTSKIAHEKFYLDR